MRSSAKKIREGTWFAFPLAHGGFCVGLVARETAGPSWSRTFSTVFGLMFPPLDDLRDLSPSDATRVMRGGALGFRGRVGGDRH
jgi:hypothetical protein